MQLGIIFLNHHCGHTFYCIWESPLWDWVGLILRNCISVSQHRAKWTMAVCRDRTRYGNTYWRKQFPRCGLFRTPTWVQTIYMLIHWDSVSIWTFLLTGLLIFSMTVKTKGFSVRRQMHAQKWTQMN